MQQRVLDDYPESSLGHVSAVSEYGTELTKWSSSDLLQGVLQVAQVALQESSQVTIADELIPSELLTGLLAAMRMHLDTFWNAMAADLDASKDVSDVSLWVSNFGHIMEELVEKALKDDEFYLEVMAELVIQL